MNDDNEIQAVPLSKDQHTPYRRDEAARCRAAGVRIMSMGQIDPSTHEPGDEDMEDPPRPSKIATEALVNTFQKEIEEMKSEYESCCKALRLCGDRKNDETGSVQ